MRLSRTLIAFAVSLLALALVLGACGDDDEGGTTTTTTTPTPAQAPSQGAAPPSVEALPPEFVECMQDRGIDTESVPDQIHSPEGEACFKVLHGGGAAP